MVLAPPRPATRLIEEPDYDTAPFDGGAGSIIINVATTADAITPWGVNWRLRDAQLRSFWPTEDVFASALFTVVAQYTAFDWSLEGPPRMVGISQDMLNNVQMGKGLSAFLVPWLIDRFTQDNGSFMELVRTDDDPRAPVITFNHLDAHRCIRTGRHEEPVIYIDLKGKWHKLKWYQVIASSEFPSPLEEARGLGYSCLTRVLRTAQTMRDIEIVKQEKAGGRFTRQIHLISGVQTSTITNAKAQKERMAIEAGWQRYVEPLIVASLDPTARVTKETIDLASIPEDYDEEKALQAYLLILALGFGTDYQNFAPLPGGGLGSSSQSKILNMKSRGKGPGLYMR